jgi:hypothetical protein
MSNRLLSLLTEIERALLARDPAPDGGSWDTMRLINYNQGLARLTLAVRSPERVTVSRGSILLQNFTLADGSQCLKANLSWAGAENSTVYAIYSKPQINWSLEASQIAAKWLDGQVAAAAPVPAEADRTMMEATG